MTTPESLGRLLLEVRACRACEGQLPLEPRPIVRAEASARILIVGQAPGTLAHETATPWNDPSGERLRSWMDVTRAEFYDTSRIAIIPMGFCYPGRTPRGGDLPPRPECKELWLTRLVQHLPAIELTLLFGQFALAHYLGSRRKKTLTETVRAWRQYAPAHLPMPHPSWRNTAWLKKNPWFEEEVVPVLRERVRGLIGS